MRHVEKTSSRQALVADIVQVGNVSQNWGVHYLDVGCKSKTEYDPLCRDPHSPCLLQLGCLSYPSMPTATLQVHRVSIELYYFPGHFPYPDYFGVISWFKWKIERIWPIATGTPLWLENEKTSGVWRVLRPENYNYRDVQYISHADLDVHVYVLRKSK